VFGKVAAVDIATSPPAPAALPPTCRKAGRHPIRHPHPLKDIVMSNPQVELHIKDHGVITLELDQDKAPKSVTNFLSYVTGHYDGTVFHRVIKNFMIQGGGFEPGMKQKGTQAPIRTRPTTA
jgi:hypothetical protein